MEQLLKIDRAIISTILTVMIMAVGISLRDTEYFSLSFAAEDGIIEYGTAIALLIASMILIRNALSMKGKATKLAVGLTFFYALLFFFGAGEEISWGQRIFGWETSDAMKAINRQDETTIHNIEIYGVALTKHLFGPILTATILLYLLVLPLLYPRFGWVCRTAIRFGWISRTVDHFGWVYRTANRLAVPVPGLRHAALALIGSLIIAAIDAGGADRAWEVYEFIFGLLIVSIFLLPQNRDKVT